MRAWFIAAGVSFARIASADPPPPDPSGAVDPSAPPLAPSPAAPAPAAPQWGTTLPLVQLDPYPEAYVDRPITLLSGMTELSIAYGFSSDVNEALGHRTPDISVRHSFGAVELTADLGEYAVVSAAIPTGSFPAVVVIGADSGVPQKDNSLHVAQFAELEHKIHVSPGQCALFFALSAGYNENRIVNDSLVLEWTHVLIASLGATLEIQLLPTVNLDLGVGYAVPVSNSADVHPISSLNAGATLVATFAHSWDIYANGGATNLADYRLPFLSFGFAKRWGG